MKKYFKFAAIAVLAMGLTVACKSKTEEPVDSIIDSTEIEAVVEDTTDSVEAVAEEVAEPVKPAKKEEVKKFSTSDAASTKVPEADPKAARKIESSKDIKEASSTTVSETPKPSNADPKATRNRR